MTGAVMGFLGVLLGMTGVAVGLLIRISQRLERIEKHIGLDNDN